MDAAQVSRPLDGLRLLVVEDNYVLAESMRWALEGLGAIVVGPAPSCQRAAALLEANPVDFGILDIDLQGVSSAPIAERLGRSSVPFLFLTGYESASLLPSEMHAITCLAKPFDPDELARCILREIGRESDSIPGRPD